MITLQDSCCSLSDAMEALSSGIAYSRLLRIEFCLWRNRLSISNAEIQRLRDALNIIFGIIEGEIPSRLSVSVILPGGREKILDTREVAEWRIESVPLPAYVFTRYPAAVDFRIMFDTAMEDRCSNAEGKADISSCGNGASSPALIMAADLIRRAAHSIGSYGRNAKRLMKALSLLESVEDVMDAAGGAGIE